MDHRDIIDKNWHELIKMIDVRHSVLWDQLKARSVISNVAVQSIVADHDDLPGQVRELLLHIQRRSPQDYLEFRQALVEADQKYVVERYLPEGMTQVAADSSKRTPTSTGHVCIIERHMADLVDKISLKHTTLWDMMVSKGIISLSDMHYITDSNRSEREQVRALLTFLCKRPWEDYLKFVDALRETRQQHIIDKLNSPR